MITLSPPAAARPGGADPITQRGNMTTPMSNPKPPEWDELSQDTLDVMKDLGEFQPTLDPVKKMVKGYTYDAECGHVIKTYWDSNALRAIAAACVQVADWLDAVGCHQHDTKPLIQDGWRALERRQDPRMWPPIDPGKEASAHAVGRELRRPDV